MRIKFRLKGKWGFLPLVICLVAGGLWLAELQAAVVKADSGEQASGRVKARQASPNRLAG